MKKKITKRIVDAAKPQDRDFFIWDTECRGFGLKVTPRGRRVYIFQYRVPGRKVPRRYTIGVHGKDGLTEHKARTEAVQMRGDVKHGLDPKKERDKARADREADITLATLCDMYVADAPRIILPRKKRPKKESTLAIDKSNIERHIKPLLGHRPIREITTEDIEDFQQDVASGKTAKIIPKSKDPDNPQRRVIVRGGPGTAARCVKVLGTVFSYAVRPKKLLTTSPVAGVEVFGSQERERFLSAAELARLGKALVALELEGFNSAAINAVRLLILTGARKSEILTLEWPWVDFERSCLRLPESKTGAKVIPLGAPALELLSTLPRVAKNKYVLPGEKKGQHFVGLSKTWATIRTKAKLADVRIHDLRHSFASVAVAGGDSLYLVGKVLGHRQAKTTERYAHLNDDPLKAVADRAANTIAAAMRFGGESGGRVVSMDRKK